MFFRLIPLIVYCLQCYVELICRLSHQIQSTDGHCCIIGEGLVHPSIIDLFASIVNYQLVSFKTSHLITSKEFHQTFIKQKLTQTYIDAGIRVSIKFFFDF